MSDFVYLACSLCWQKLSCVYLTQSASFFGLAYSPFLGYTCTPMRKLVQLFIASGFVFAGAPFLLTGCGADEAPEEVTEEQEQEMEEEGELEE